MTRPTFIALIAVLFLAGPARAQELQELKYWVFLSDKPANASKVSPITERALERRRLRASRVPGHLDAGVSDEYVAAIEHAGGQVVVRSRWLNAVSVRLAPGELSQVEALPFVRRVSPVGVVEKPESVITPSVPLFGRTAPAGPAAFRLDYGGSFTQLDMVGAIDGLESGLSGDGVLLGILDTYAGDLSQPAVSHIKADNRLVGQENFTGFAECTGPGVPAGCDPNRHALSVLSVAAGFDPGNLIGPAYGADIILAHTEYAPTETNQEEDNFVAGLEWMESQGADVINVSLGYSTFDAGQSDYTYQDMDGNTAITTRAADLAVGLGVVMINSAGNEGSSFWRFITSPADGDSVITVGAATTARTVASFSSRGPTSDGRIKPDVSALGQGVTVATTSGYTPGGNGTSFAAPMVAGAVAMILEANPNLTPMEIRHLLRSTASQSGAPNNDLGWGIINVQAALASVSTRQPEVPSNRILSSMYPNPASGQATLNLDLPTSGPVTLEVLDVLGRRVLALQWSDLPPGENRLPIELPTGSSGWFGYRVVTASGTATGAFTALN